LIAAIYFRSYFACRIISPSFAPLAISSFRFSFQLFADTLIFSTFSLAGFSDVRRLSGAISTRHGDA